MVETVGGLTVWTRGCCRDGTVRDIRCSYFLGGAYRTTAHSLVTVRLILCNKQGGSLGNQAASRAGRTRPREVFTIDDSRFPESLANWPLLYIVLNWYSQISAEHFTSWQGEFRPSFHHQSGLDSIRPQFCSSISTCYQGIACASNRAA